MKKIIFSIIGIVVAIALIGAVVGVTRTASVGGWESTQTVARDSGHSWFTYWLMYHWMSGGMNTNTTIYRDRPVYPSDPAPYTQPSTTNDYTNDSFSGWENDSPSTYFDDSFNDNSYTNDSFSGWDSWDSGDSYTDDSFGGWDSYDSGDSYMDDSFSDW